MELRNFKRDPDNIVVTVLSLSTSHNISKAN